MIKGFQTILRNPAKSFSTSKTLSLYTWGRQACGLGFPHEDPSEHKTGFYAPKKLPNFDGKIKKVSMGPYHSAVVTTDGSLFSFGSNKHGALGFEKDEKYVEEPKIVDFFKANKLKVADVACGDNFTVVLTECGNLYTFGYGGECKLSFLNKWFGVAWGLGNGHYESTFIPTRVDQFSGNVTQITASEGTVTVVTKDNDVYNWGNGRKGTFGNNTQDYQFTPVINLHIKNLVKTQNSKIKKVKSAGDCSAILLENGNIFTMGDDHYGVTGTRKNRCIIEDTFVTVPKPISRWNMKDEKIVDFDIGKDSLVILLDSGKLMYSGLGAVWQPINFELPSNYKAIKFAAGYESIAVLTDSNEVFSLGEFLPNSIFRPSIKLYKADLSLFGNGKVHEFGGAYSNRYALVEN